MKLIYICTHNACRSILSEAITRRLASDRIQVASAGTSPRESVHPLTLKYLSKHGYDTADLHSNSLESVRLFAPNVAITVCDSAAGESCPLWMDNAIKVHWGLPDPSRNAHDTTETEAAFAAVMKRITARVERLLAEPFEALDAQQLKTLLNEIGNQT